jgi:hypothetical protein
MVLVLYRPCKFTKGTRTERCINPGLLPSICGVFGVSYFPWPAAGGLSWAGGWIGSARMADDPHLRLHGEDPPSYGMCSRPSLQWFSCSRSARRTATLFSFMAAVECLSVDKDSILMVGDGIGMVLAAFRMRLWRIVACPISSAWSSDEQL